MRRFFATRIQAVETDVLLLAFRIAAGAILITTGWNKIQDPLHWMGKEASMPSLLQSLAAVSEFIGGIALIAGLITRLAAFGIACTMAVAAYKMLVEYKAPYV